MTPPSNRTRVGSGHSSLAVFDPPKPSDLQARAVEIVTAYVTNNVVPMAELPGLIASVHGALVTIGQAVDTARQSYEPAVPVKQSITTDHLISLIDGKRDKTLKRHLARHGLTMAQYRERYGLPHDYPSVASSYSAQRAEVARTMRLGVRRGFEKVSRKL